MYQKKLDARHLSCSISMICTHCIRHAFFKFYFSKWIADVYLRWKRLHIIVSTKHLLLLCVSTWHNVTTRMAATTLNKNNKLYVPFKRRCWVIEYSESVQSMSGIDIMVDTFCFAIWLVILHMLNTSWYVANIFICELVLVIDDTIHLRYVCQWTFNDNKKFFSSNVDR